MHQDNPLALLSLMGPPNQGREASEGEETKSRPLKSWGTVTTLEPNGIHHSFVSHTKACVSVAYAVLRASAVGDGGSPRVLDVQA